MITADATVAANSESVALEAILPTPRWSAHSNARERSVPRVMAGVSRAMVLNLYRRWLKAASSFPEKRLRKKLRFVGAQ